jgi:hypothetical protein
MGRALRLHRNKAGQVSYTGELPERQVFSAGYVESGGIEGVLADYQRLTEEGDKAAAKLLNRTPMFDRDGMDVLFQFPEGQVRYRFVGFDRTDDGRINHDALVYERVT